MPSRTAGPAALATCDRRTSGRLSQVVSEELEERVLLYAGDPNDSFAGAWPVQNNAVFNGSISQRTDVDMIKLDVVPGSYLRVDVDSPNSNLQSRLFVYDSQGRLIASAGEGRWPGEPRDRGDAFLQTVVPATRRVFVAIAGWANTSFDPETGNGDRDGRSVGSYKLRARYYNYAPADDQIANAAPLPVGRQLTARIDRGRDVDMFAVRVRAGQELRVDVDSPRVRVDTYMRLFDARGRQIAASDDDRAPGEPLDSLDPYIRRQFDRTQTVYVGISSHPNTAYNPISGRGDRDGLSTGRYRITATAFTPNDRNNQLREAARLTSGRPVNEAINSRLDVDLYRINVGAGQELRVDLDTPGSSLDTYVRLFDVFGRNLGSNNNGRAPGESNTGGDSYLAKTFSRPQTVYIGVSGNGNTAYSVVTGRGNRLSSTIGRFTLTATVATPEPPDDNDQLREARTIGDSQAGGFTIDKPQDVDMYRVDLQAGQRLFADVDSTTRGFNSYLRLFDDRGRQLKANDTGLGYLDRSRSADPALDYRTDRARTVYVAVSSSRNTRYNAITGSGDASQRVPGTTGSGRLVVHVTDGVPPDPNDEIPEVSARAPLALGRYRTSLTPGYDVDVVKVEAKAGELLTVDIDTPESDVDTYVRLFDENGRELATSDFGLAPDDAAAGEPGFEPDDPFLQYLSPVDRAVYVAVSHADNRLYDPLTGNGDTTTGGTGVFSITLGSTPLPADDDDQLAEATAAQPGQLFTGTIDNGADVDMYRMDVVEGATYRVSLATPNSDLQGYIRLFAPDGRELIDNSDGDTSVVLVAPFSGTVFLGLSSQGNTTYDPIAGTGDLLGATTGSYEISAELLAGPEDHRTLDALMAASV